MLPLPTTKKKQKAMMKRLGEAFNKPNKQQYKLLMLWKVVI